MCRLFHSRPIQLQPFTIYPLRYLGAASLVLASAGISYVSLAGMPRRRAAQTEPAEPAGGWRVVPPESPDAFPLAVVFDLEWAASTFEHAATCLHGSYTLWDLWIDVSRTCILRGMRQRLTLADSCYAPTYQEGRHGQPLGGQVSQVVCPVHLLQPPRLPPPPPCIEVTWTDALPRRGQSLEFYREVPAILAELKRRRIHTAAASRTSAPEL